MGNKGFGKQIYLVGAIVIVFIFIYALWSSLSPYLQQGFDTAFTIAGG